MEAASAIFGGEFDDAVEEDADVDMDRPESVPSRSDSKRKAASVTSFNSLRSCCSFRSRFRLRMRATMKTRAPRIMTSTMVSVFVTNALPMRD